MGTKHAVVALIGKPNAGKSTIFNQLQKNDFAITSSKPQTTRNAICSFIDFKDNKQATLIDTPGFHEANNKLDTFLNSEIKNSIKQATIGLFIFDVSREFDYEDKKILEFLFNSNIEKKVLVMNKIDSNKKNAVPSEYKFDSSIEISAKQNYNLDKLLAYIEDNTIEENLDVSHFTRPTDEFITSEIIREVCIHQLKKELPYAVGVMINEFNYDKEKNLLNIDANIVIEKESQKPIVVGSKGSMIKKIGIESRKKLLDIYDCKINLKLFVKVKNDWRNNDYEIRSLGYKL